MGFEIEYSFGGRGADVVARLSGAPSAVDLTGVRRSLDAEPRFAPGARLLLVADRRADCSTVTPHGCRELGERIADLALTLGPRGALAIATDREDILDAAEGCRLYCEISLALRGRQRDAAPVAVLPGEEEATAWLAGRPNDRARRFTPPDESSVLACTSCGADDAPVYMLVTEPTASAGLYCDACAELRRLASHVLYARAVREPEQHDRAGTW